MTNQISNRPLITLPISSLQLNALYDPKSRPTVFIQGGGAKGIWQAGFLEAIIDKGLDPVAFIGSSAGAINTALANGKLDPSISLSIGDFWKNLAKLSKRTALSNRVQKTGIFKFGWFYFAKHKILPWMKDKTRSNGLASFNDFIAFLQDCGLKVGPAQRYTYLSYTNLDTPKIPPVFNTLSDSEYTFYMFKPGALIGEDLASGEQISINTAAAISAVLPPITPYRSSNGRTLGDGGFFENLPAKFVRTNGSIGGDYILFILSKPPQSFDMTDPIDYRVVNTIRNLNLMQLRARRELKLDARGGPALTRSPILLAFPDHIPKGEKWMQGLFDEKVAEEDYDLGYRSGEGFFKNMRDDRDWVTSRLISLISRKLPMNPMFSPGYSSGWLHYVNRDWFGQRIPGSTLYYL